MARRLPHRFSLLTFGVAGNPNENISREACCGFAATIHRGYQNAGSGRFVSGTRGSPVSRRNVIRREPLKFWRSSVNTEPALDPAFLRCVHVPLPQPLRSPAAHTSTRRSPIYLRMDGKGLRTKLPDHNGGATRPVGHGKPRDPRLRSEFCTPAFACSIQGACGSPPRLPIHKRRPLGHSVSSIR